MVAILYTVTKGYLDEVPTARIRDFEQGFYRFLEAERGDLVADLARTKTLSDDIAAGLDDAIRAFKETFLADQPARAASVG
jgi:F-type H+-transporting ATPase subunit alpha